MRTQTRIYPLYVFLFVLFLLLGSKAYAVDIFKPAPKIQIYDTSKKQFLFRDKVQKTDAQWRRDLPPEIYVITRNRGTELPFTNKYWNNHAKGIYKCFCCGIDLFASDSKFDSGCGWPSFDKPVMETNIIQKEDKTLPETKTEVLCARCEAHLGYVESDENRQTHMRYLIDSAALTFDQFDNQLH